MSDQVYLSYKVVPTGNASQGQSETESDGNGVIIS